MIEDVSTAGAVKAPAAAFGGGKLTAGIVVAAVIAVAGIVLWGMQLSGGMVQTGMRNLDSWGLYIACFMFFVGLGTGSLIIGAVPNAFGLKGFAGISKVATAMALACMIAAVAFVIVDLGQPLRMWELFVYSNVTSPLMWDIFTIPVYMVLLCAYLWATMRFEAGRMSQGALRVLSVVVLSVAVLVLLVDGWIFSLQPGREIWHTALLGPWFVSSALVCGTALVVCSVVALRAAGYLKAAHADVVSLAKCLGAFVCVDLAFFACDLITEAYSGGSAVQVAQMLTSGVLAPFFWVEIIGCVICAIVCFVPKLRTAPFLVLASLLAIVGIFCKRAQLLIGGFQLPTIDLTGPMTSVSALNWQSGMTGVYEGLVYWPQPLEFGVTIGVVALSVLVFLLAVKLLPLGSRGE